MAASFKMNCLEYKVPEREATIIFITKFVQIKLLRKE